jgi:hypothetical protein
VGEKGQKKKVAMKMNFNVNFSSPLSLIKNFDGRHSLQGAAKTNLHDFVLAFAVPFLLTLQLPCVTSGVININQKVFFTSKTP